MWTALSPADLIATLSESTASSFLPRLHDRMISTPEGRQIMRDRPELDSAVMPRLKALRRGTLGREWVEWCERGGVTPDTREPVSVGVSDSLFSAPLCSTQAGC